MNFISLSEINLDPPNEELNDPVEILIFIETLPQDEALNFLSDYFKRTPNV